MGKVNELVERLEKRKEAIVGDEREGCITRHGFEAILMLFSGTDVDPDEVFECANMAALATLTAIMRGDEAVAALMSLWADGLATGLQAS